MGLKRPFPVDKIARLPKVVFAIVSKGRSRLCCYRPLFPNNSQTTGPDTPVLLSFILPLRNGVCLPINR